MKTRYSIPQNVAWMMKIAWKVRKRVLVICILTAAFEILYGLNSISRRRLQGKIKRIPVDRHISICYYINRINQLVNSTEARRKCLIEHNIRQQQN